MLKKEKVVNNKHIMITKNTMKTDIWTNNETPP